MVRKGDVMFIKYVISDTIPTTGNRDTIYLVPNVETGIYDEYIFYSDNKPVCIGRYVYHEELKEELKIEDAQYITNCHNCSAPVRPGKRCEYCGTWVYIRGRYE